MHKKITFITIIFTSIWFIAAVEKVPIYQVCQKLFIYSNVFAWFFWGFIFSLPLIHKKIIEYKRKYIVDDFQVKAVELFTFSKKEPVYEKETQSSIELITAEQNPRKIKSRINHNYES